jgi:uncharacterized membrane protein
MFHRKCVRRLAVWAVPLLYAAIALTAGLTVPRLETRLLPGLVSPMSPSAAMAVYSSIASGMIALTGIVFSLAFVMVQFSATAYSPRLVRWIAHDPVMSHALGIFVSSFLYPVAALSGIDRGGSGTVPIVSVGIVVALLTASVGMFVALIHRIGRLQIQRMLVFTGDQGRDVIATLYPPLGSAAETGAPREFRNGPRTQTVAHRGRPRSIQAVDVKGLVELAERAGGIIEMAVNVGDTIVELTPLLHVWGARAAVDERALGNRIEMGEERTFEQDPKYAIRLLVDIAIRALSPAVNDPTTAVQALDQIEDMLMRLGLRRLDVGRFCGGDGELRLVVPFPTWDDFLLLAFDEIRFYGATSVQVMRRMMALVSDLIEVLPPERHAALQHWHERLASTVARSFVDAEEKLEAAVEDRQGLGVPRRRAGGGEL